MAGADNARHVVRFRLTEDTRVYNVEDDMAGDDNARHVVRFRLTQEPRVYNE